MSSTVAPNLVSAVDEARQWDRLMELAKIGAIRGADGSEGVNRACLTPGDREARRLMIRWATAAGLTVSTDEIGNLFFRHEGTEAGAAPILTGSHMDSQPNGGRFDGIWGVVAGLEAVQAIREAGVATKRPIEVVTWTNEEGGRFAPGCMGSMAWAGHSPPDAWDATTDPDGITFRAALDEHLAAERDIPRRGLGSDRPHAYVEAHIEQGPLLEAADKEIGVVTGIQGSRWFVVEIRGETAHAGTAPVSLRKDAVQDFVRAATALNALMADPTDVLRFTIGRVEVIPGASNTVADLVRFTIDFRHPDKDMLILNGDAIDNTVRTAVKACEVTMTERFHALPVEFDAMIADAVEDAATAQGLSTMRLPSGAFHDAQFCVPVCPSGMIFVPSRGGISHNPAEYSSAEQLAKGARVLAATLVELANR